jgi:ELWxxDGT repeat protein
MVAFPLRLFVVAGVVAAASAQQLVLDIRQGPPLPMRPNSSGYYDFGNGSVSDGTRAFFSGLSYDGGIELWTSDGTVAGTHQVSDLLPGPSSSAATPIGMLGSRVLVQSPPYYIHGPGYVPLPFTFWASDGTAAGTTPILQWSGIAPSPRSVQALGQLPNALLLNVFSPGSTALVRTDLTAAGTQVIGTGADPGVLLGTEFLWAGVGGLWHSNGSSSGTGLLVSVPGILNSLVLFGNFVFFLASSNAGTLALWRTDGTANGTVQVFDTGVAGFPLPGKLAVVGGRLLLLDGATPTESAWLDTGTATAMQVVATVPSSASTSWSSIVSDGTRAFFTRGGDVWTSDGTPAGTTLVATVSPAPSLTNGLPLPTGFVRHGRGILRMGGSVVCSDGTASGTFALPSGGGLTLFEQVSNGVVFAFLFNGVAGPPQIQFTDGTVAGTTVLHTAMQPQGIVAGTSAPLDDALLIMLQDPANSVSLWRSDGTAAGTFPLQAIGPAPPNGPLFDEIVAVDGAAYFLARDPADPRYGVWRTDGSVAGTTLLHAATTGCYGLRVDGHGLFFCDGTALWRSDGTSAGTARVLDIGAISAPERTNAGVFVYDHSPFGGGVWRSDGTATGTFPLPIPNGSTIAGLGDRVLVANGDLWATDGSTAGTVDLGSMPFFFELDPSGRPRVAVSQGRAFLLATTDRNSGSVVLVATDGTVAGTTQLPLPAQLGSLTAANGKAWFVGGDDHGSELWVSDGTAAGTHRATDVAPGLGNGVVSVAPVGDGSGLFLAASDGTDGLEPYVSDGTAAGTVRILDISPNGSSNPQYVGLANGRVFFLADDGVTGQELWSMPLSMLGNASVEPLGRGCAGSAGVPELGSNAPHLGQPLTFTLQHAPAVVPVVFAFASLRVPIALPSGCVQQLSFGAVTALAISDLRGTATLALTVPNAPALVGASLIAQVAALDPFGTAIPGVAASNGLRVFVGR